MAKGDPKNRKAPLRSTAEVLLKKYLNLFSNALAEHQIETGDAYPVTLPPYRVPRAYRDSLERENFERNGKGWINRTI